jgi:peptidoglycan/xylan/chitin deacetylase (PgdA/CDA1 family)
MSFSTYCLLFTAYPLYAIPYTLYAYAMRIFLLLLLLLTAYPAMAANHAVIIMYHRFGEDNYPSTNIGLDQFAQHIQILQTEGFTILPLPDIIAAIENGKELPDKTVGITIDDAALSVYTAGWPIFLKHRLPFTLFVTTDDIDRGSKYYMNWDQLRELRDSGLVTIGNHSTSHPSFAKITPLQIAQELSQARQRFITELGAAPELFAYPYGEFSTAAQNAVKKFGFAYAFGQHSGVYDRNADALAIPRFALNENYGAASRFRQAASALALPISGLTPSDALQPLSPTEISFTLEQTALGKNLSCFLSELGQAELRQDGARITASLPNPWGPGRQRINCTAPTSQGRYYWWGTQYVIAPPSPQ